VKYGPKVSWWARPAWTPFDALMLVLTTALLGYVIGRCA
jgi:hypothetical protein